MIKHLYSRMNSHQWSKQSRYIDFDSYDGVLLRKARDSYVCHPASMNKELVDVVTALNVQVAFTMRCETIDVLVAKLSPQQTTIRMLDQSQLQVIDSLSEVSSSKTKKFQYACLVRREKLLLVWHDDMQRIIPHATNLEEKLLSIVSHGSSNLELSLLTIIRFGAQQFLLSTAAHRLDLRATPSA